jgi:16S rRNA (adenine1518-N6/adenine1519-N6)-dimethyltransferase
VDSALLALTRKGGAASQQIREVVRAAFAHRRKALAGSLELSGLADRAAVHSALAELGLPVRARAETLAPEEFAALAAKLAA